MIPRPRRFPFRPFHPPHRSDYISLRIDTFNDPVRVAEAIREVLRKHEQA